VQATEEDLWGLFSPLGQILELYVLRNNNGKSRGCAFVTYASKQLAELATTQLNGRAMPSGKTLVVKFADRAAATKPLAGGLMNMYMQ
jgi:CUG-BP- and ETR3-like factor